MPLETPSWWYRKTGMVAAALSPLAALYGRVAASRMAKAEAYRSRLPVICIGNFTAGGGGKTPTAIAVATLLKAIGRKPAFLTRGYGGAAKGLVQVSEGQSAAEVGDEPLLLAAVAPTIVSADRVAGAKAIEATDADVIVMDDGFQNPSLAKDLALIVVDAASGLGNGRVIPAGPLRAPLDVQIARADALAVIGEGKKADALIAAFEAAGKPVLRAKIAPTLRCALARRPAGDRLCRDRAASEVLRHAQIKRRAADRQSRLSRPPSLHRERGEASSRRGGGQDGDAGDDGEGLGAAS